MKLRLVCALIMSAAMLSCSGDRTNPLGPGNTTGIHGVSAAAVAQCEDDHLEALSPVLHEWEDSLETWRGEEFLDTPPEYSGETTPDDYLTALSPVLAQWETAIEDWQAGDTILTTPPTYGDDSVPVEYLLALSPVLLQWETALEAIRGEDFLPSPPEYFPDTTVPSITCPDSMTVDCTGPDGTIVDFDLPEAMDDCDPDPSVVCEPASGSTFPLGETIVTCTATDSAGNSAQCMFSIVVQDTTPPVINCPADTTVDCAGPEGTVVNFEATAGGDCDPNPTVMCDPPSGSMFAMGTTIVTCTATDASGNSSQGTFTVTVQDTTPPVVESATASPNELWPPNHKMTRVRVSVDAWDLCGEVTTAIVDVSSNEPADGLGDGNTEPDWAIVGDMIVQLRAERSGRDDGRVYTILVECADESGNITLCTVDVVVPHDRGWLKKSAGF